MKSGSDMSQSHRPRAVECQGRNRAAVSRRVRDASGSVYVSARQRQHGPGQTGIRPVRQYPTWHGRFVLREWPPSQPTQGQKTGAGGGRDRPLLLPPFTRVQRYIGRDPPSQAGTAGTQIRLRLLCTSTSGPLYRSVRVGWKMKSRDGLNNGCVLVCVCVCVCALMPHITRTHIQHIHRPLHCAHTHMRYLTRACNHHYVPSHICIPPKRNTLQPAKSAQLGCPADVCHFTDCIVATIRDADRRPDTGR